MIDPDADNLGPLLLFAVLGIALLLVARRARRTGNSSLDEVSRGYGSMLLLGSALGLLVWAVWH